MTAMKEETQKKLKFAEYDIRKGCSWAQSVYSGQDHFKINRISMKIRYKSYMNNGSATRNYKT